MYTIVCIPAPGLLLSFTVCRHRRRSAPVGERHDEQVGRIRRRRDRRQLERTGGEEGRTVSEIFGVLPVGPDRPTKI